MAAVAAAYRSMDMGSMLFPKTPDAVVEDGFEFLPNQDPATFVEEFQHSSSVDNRLVIAWSVQSQLGFINLVIKRTCFICRDIVLGALIFCVFQCIVCLGTN